MYANNYNHVFSSMQGTIFTHNSGIGYPDLSNQGLLWNKQTTDTKAHITRGGGAHQNVYCACATLH